MTGYSRALRLVFGTQRAALLLFMQNPWRTLVLASFGRCNSVGFPIPAQTTRCCDEASHGLVITSFPRISVAIAVSAATIARSSEFLGGPAFALSLARPLAAPEAPGAADAVRAGRARAGPAVGLTALGVTRSSPATVFAHHVWIAPIVTFMIALQVEAFDTTIEDAAVDPVTARWQVPRDVTLPTLAPGPVSDVPLASLLSWSDLPLSMSSIRAVQGMPEWMTASILAAGDAAAAAVTRWRAAAASTGRAPRRPLSATASRR